MTYLQYGQKCWNQEDSLAEALWTKTGCLFEHHPEKCNVFLHFELKTN